MKYFYFFATILTLFILANLAKIKAYEDVPYDRNPKLWRIGKNIYRARCTTCHNDNPDLFGTSGPKTRGASEEYLYNMFANGKHDFPAKPQFKKLVPSLREYLK